MEFKDRSSYDDIFYSGGDKNRPNSRLDKKARNLIVVVIVLVLVLFLAVVLIWLFNFSSFADKPKTELPTVKIVDVIEEEKIKGTSEAGDPKIDAKEAITVIETPQPRREVSELEFGSNWYIEHTVSKDQTLESISELYAITRETLLSVNAIKNISSVKEGSVLKIPKQNGQLYTVVVGDSLSTISNRFNPNLGWKNLQQINALSSEVIYPGQKIFIPSAQVEDDGSFASFDRFVKPADGRITGLYGQTVVYGQSENVVTLKGIWIEGASQSPIFASGSGNVEEIGNDVRGSGNYVVLKHDYGYRTTYAHLDRIDVKIDDEIKKGQQIGIMGQSGNIGKRALYFSIEQEGVALNPANFF